MTIDVTVADTDTGPVVLSLVREPKDLRALSDAELAAWCREVRAFLVQAVSARGGHLGSNLGVVELTAAVHRVFESPRDMILWDTGHQAYVHKLVTGRMEDFARLRVRSGLSGSPSRAESAHDVYENSHGSGRRSGGAVASPALPGLPEADYPADQLRLMAVHAHPDDESSKGAATMARYVRSGVDVLVCTLTGGERGDILNKAMERPEVRANLPTIRRQEMARAREILGVKQRFLGFTDSGLPEGEPLPPLPEGCFALQKLEDAAAPLVHAVREFRPHVMLTYDETGGYPHPDHVKTHEVAVEAFEAAGDPDRYTGTGDPWQPLKLYYFATFHRERFTALHEEMQRRGLESPYAEWLARWDDESSGGAELSITTRVECSEYFAIRDQALLAHETQIDPASSWFACPVEVQRVAWPTEDYHLARSVVDTGLPEDDLFAGIRERVGL